MAAYADAAYDSSGDYIGISAGLAGTGGAGAGGGGSKGFVIAFSDEGASAGSYRSHSLGSEFGFGLSGGFVFGFDPFAKSIWDFAGDSLTIGGSGGEGLVLGGDLNINQKNPGGSVSGFIGLGLGSAAEGHIFHTHTDITSGFDVTTLASKIRNGFINFFLGHLDNSGVFDSW
jgi:hypothetical protein